MTEHHELELKLVVDPADADRIAGAALFTDAVARAQTSVYYDTPAATIRKAGFSLRIRAVDDRRIRTVKADGGATAGLFARPEWEDDVEGDDLRIDRAVLPALFPSDEELAGLGAAFTVTVTRSLVERAVEGATIELVLDRGEVAAGDARDPVSEIELEMKQGAAAALFALARELDAIAPVRLGVLTKSERGYRLIAGKSDRPVKAAPLHLDPELTTAQGFQAIAQACLRQFRLNEDILARTGDADALHQARVGLRRLRSALSTFKELLADDRFEHLRGELRWVAGVLGEARNIDVLVARVDDEALRTRLASARTAAYDEVTAALGSSRCRTLMIDLAEWLALGDWFTAPADPARLSGPLRAFAGDALDRYRRRLKRKGRKLASLDDERRHRVRIDAKKLRYSAEFFAPLFDGGKAIRRRKAFLAALEELQGDLGELNDLAAAPGVLAALDLPTDAIAATPGAGGRKALLKRSEEAMAALVDLKRFWR